ncbi:MAG: 50S ribosomal protein L35 [Candidatus Sungiibacteriota bacterium]|uniref:50S ribosomal protein L35 n=1 Tax=Candidatus Sungiibacteriota bacterium TaxID=2750080 RepID=A0A7T5RIX1_9BACT|nr:MAG: 50S ribosomal protein L35 [Candidatus Sungbacteria bacterium]
MRKAVLKRIKITKTGKLLYRKSGQNHFNAKASRRVQLRKKTMTRVGGRGERKLKVYMNQL